MLDFRLASRGEVCNLRSSSIPAIRFNLDEPILVINRNGILNLLGFGVASSLRLLLGFVKWLFSLGLDFKVLAPSLSIQTKRIKD